MKPSIFGQRRRQSFTIVELLVVMAIMALLAGLALPGMQLGIRKAQSVQCSENLRGIGSAVLAWAADNNETLPEINQTAPPGAYPSSVPGLIGVLGNYGVMTNTLKCPTDLAQGPASSFTQYGSSYEWNPVLDDGTEPVTTLPLGPVSVTVNVSRVRVCTDFLPLHNHKMNALYGDGHVRAR
jgi:prepilin-type processing-associated H-X9-DG protein